ncbi:MAG TPA: hypothetical protein VK147_08095 [Candidatus Didemnitutus sp.]|nr:hypothetical protein [Candidatus Didemnitutus sp.]
MSKQPRYGSGGRSHVGSTIVNAAMALVCVLLPTIIATAQPLSTVNWYFGQRAGVTFRSGSIEALADGQLNTSEGCATFSDPTTGELLFYTDGVTVWNRIHEIMPNGMGLFGDPSTSQSALIIPAPGRPYIFYVFNPAPVTSAIVGSRCLCLYYSIIDMRADAGFGDVVKKNELVLNDITEHLTATADCSGDGSWIVVRSRSTRHFYSFHLVRDQLTTLPVVSDGGNPTLIVRDAGQMHISPDSRQLVITSATGNSQLYDFDAQTGKVTNGINLFKTEVFGSHYGAAFSSDSKKLYISVANEGPITPTRIYQFSIGVKDATAITDSKYILGELSGTYNWTPMQLAPDGRIYIGRSGQPWLAMIESPNADSSLAALRDTAVRLTGVCRFGLPNLIGSSLIDPALRLTACSLPRASFAFPADICEERCISIRDESTGSIDSWQWYFEGGSPSSSIERNPQQICYDRSGVYSIRLVVSNGYGTDTAYSFISVMPRPAIRIDSVDEICPGTPVQLRATGADSYVWSPPQLVSDPFRSDPVVRPRSTTRFTVIGTNSYGCKDTSTVLVRVTDMSAGKDASICVGAFAQISAQGAETYSWVPSDGLSDPQAAEPVAFPPRTTEYVVTMQRGQCIVRDTVVVTVVDSFSVKIAGPNRTCIGDTLILSPSAGTSHAWSGIGIVDTTATVARVVMGKTPTMIRLIARSGDCLAFDSLMVQPVLGPPLELGPDQRVCLGESTVLAAQTSALDVVWTPADGLDRTTGTTVICRPSTTTQYIASARGDSGCVNVDTITVVVLPRPDIVASPDTSICVGGSVQIHARGSADRVEWSPVTGLSDPSAPSPIASPTQTTTYVLRALTGTCESLDTVTVFVSSLNVSISPDTTICRGEFTTLRASGAVRYEWSPPTGLSDPTRDQPLASPQTTTRYTVRGFDQLGCEQTRSVTVSVRDTASIRLIAGSVTASAGSDDVGIPIFVEVPSSLLPLKITVLRATLVNNASTFIPDSTDRGALRTSLRGDDRLSYLFVEDLLVISARQKITEVRGLVLAGTIETAPLTWEDVEWKGEACPTIRSTSGLLYISGCNLTGRALRNFLPSMVAVRPMPSQDVVDVDLKANMPGPYHLRLVDLDGRVIWSTSIIRTDQDLGAAPLTIDMSTVSTGLYTLHVAMPANSETIPFVWIR